MNKINLELIVFYVLLIDSIGANLLAWTGRSWYIEHFRTISRYFPLAKGWTTLYLILVLFIGYIVLK